MTLAYLLSFMAGLAIAVFIAWAGFKLFRL